MERVSVVRKQSIIPMKILKIFMNHKQFFWRRLLSRYVQLSRECDNLENLVKKGSTTLSTKAMHRQH